MIVLKQISKSFGALEALKPTDLTIPAGTTTALIGPSGCGKSTLLRLIVGLVQPTSGSVEVNSQSVDPATIQSIRRQMGYVIQDGGLFPHLTAEGNVLLMSRHLGIDETKIQKRLRELCDTHAFPGGCAFALSRRTVRGPTAKSESNESAAIGSRSSASG